MIIQISSGQGPIECEIAVRKLYESLKKEYNDLTTISDHKNKRTGEFTSITFHTEQDLSGLEGSILWICKSPSRPHHKRKNWYVDVSIIPELNIINTDDIIRFEKFHCGGNGGQNVNKVETGIRLIHIPTGIVVISTSQRSQYQNKKYALMKLNVILSQKQKEEQDKQTNSAWSEHTKIIRGNPVRTYEGLEFKRKR